jgi:hypothetical protein
MKGFTQFAIVGGVALVALGGVLAATNPNQESYEAFATQQLTIYLEKNLCEQSAQEMGLGSTCRSLLQSNQGKIAEFVADNTQRQNFIFFSLYTTDLSLTSFLPSYHFETAGFLHQFHVYQAKRN